VKKPERIAGRALQSSNREQIRRSSRKLKRAVILFSSIIALGTILLLTLVIIEQNESAEARAWNDTYNLSGAFEEQVRRVIDSLRGALSLLKPRLAAEGDAFDLVDWVAHAPEFAAPTVQIAFVGANGRLVSTSLERKPSPINLSDREHIRVHMSGHKGLFIGKPVTGRVSGQITIQVSDRVESADGKLAGIVVFSLSPDFLTTLHGSVRLGKTGSMILAGSDGVIRAAFGGSEVPGRRSIGKSLAGMKFFADAKGLDGGAYKDKSPLNGKATFFYWRKVSNYPLIVVVGLGKGEVFAVVNRSAAMLAVLGLGVLVLTVLTTLILNREINRRVRREIALFEESRKLFHANGNLRKRHRQLLTASAALVSERARLQRLNTELIAAKEAADQASQAKSSLLMNMSHEFRTPMHAILNYASMGLRKVDGGDVQKLKKYLSNIQISGVRLLGMLNALLDLAKLESGRLDIRMSRADLAQIARQSQAELGSLLEAKQLRLHIECATEETCATFDKQRMMQVFVNLLSNAIRFSPPGGAIKIGIRDAVLDKQRPALHCSVEDEGTGIPEADLETVFDKFAQSSRRETGAGGSGLGLAICREIVHLHEGKIWAANAPTGGGAVIHFVLPKALSPQPSVTLLPLRHSKSKAQGIFPQNL
jgi:signal transduction histidine kinase